MSRFLFDPARTRSVLAALLVLCGGKAVPAAEDRQEKTETVSFSELVDVKGFRPAERGAMAIGKILKVSLKNK